MVVAETFRWTIRYVDESSTMLNLIELLNLEKNLIKKIFYSTINFRPAIKDLCFHYTSVYCLFL